MLVGELQLALGAQHAARFDTADLGDRKRHLAARDVSARRREHTLHPGMRVRRAADDLHGLSTGIHHADAELVGVGMGIGGDDARDLESGKRRRLVLDVLDFKADARRAVGHGHGVRRCIEMLFEPGKRELHRLKPPSSVGISSAWKPKCLSQRMSESKNGRKSGMPYLSIARRSIPSPKA